jgi:hypothetical protein
MVAKLQKKQKEYYLARGMEVPEPVGAVQEVESGRKKGKRKSGARVEDDSEDDGLAEGSAFAMRLQAGGGSKSSLVVSSRVLNILFR